MLTQCSKSVLNLLLITGLLIAAAPASAANATCTVSQPRNTVPKPVMLSVTLPDSSMWGVNVMIMPGMTVSQKRDAFVAQINASGHSAVAAAGPDKFTVQGLAPGSTLKWTDGGTCEQLDKIVVAAAPAALVEFRGVFEPLDTLHQPAIFTAGIVTDVGELTATVSAQELNFQTDGPIICQALFQRLAPRAPQYGTQINYAGDRLEVYFDPAYTVTQGGIIFGTGSPSQGCGGSVLVPTAPPTGNGDMNCDGRTDILDINAFLLAISNPAAYAALYPDCNILNGDMNGDGVVNILDINPFIAQLGN
ncbi:hypothetical protein RAS1_38110 [Phycisphaerae bacterium RAS1]|nr:hypothetical protein RAS1_38110 [Phycisphaerae bacterium RAS1]